MLYIVCMCIICKSGQRKVCHLELEDLVRKLGDSVDLVITEILGDLGHGRDHRRGSAQEDLDVSSRGRDVLLDHVGVHKSNATSPSLRGIVENIVDLELRVLLGEQVQLCPQQDILLVHVGKDKVDLGLVLGVLHNGTNDLLAKVKKKTGQHALL
jgi:hypothetical protein